ncbi:hypothetical protein SMD22_01500 (plasmid) [Brevibacillus halotolerans]|nr:hypothetical protein SMD22_01500 [Brevibacillus halotolerans]
MGEMADYFIERQLNRHMNPEREIYRERRERQAFMENLSDEGLLIVAETAIKDNNFNEKFIHVAKKIINQKPKTLSEKQRNSLYGLLSNNIR